MDEVFVKILQGDDHAVMVFFQGGSRAITMAFADRLSGRLAAAGIHAKGQIKFLPRLEGAVFRSALGLADVVLDTLHWSGGGTSLDAFAAEVPVIALPGGYMRGRQTSAMLRLMGLEQLIASDIDDYVAKAIDIASNQVVNASIRETIATRKANLFGRAEANAEFAEKVYSTALAHINTVA
jgi:predicted O-linked N-acetylglucosamine transferase (SPINDLY family)